MLIWFRKIVIYANFGSAGSLPVYRLEIVSFRFISQISVSQIKDLVMVTSSTVSPNDGTIRILTHFFCQNPQG